MGTFGFSLGLGFLNGGLILTRGPGWNPKPETGLLLAILS